MENKKLLENLSTVFEATRQSVDIEDFLDVVCEDQNIDDWMSLAGFLLEFDRRNADALEPKIRGCFICCMYGLRFNPADWILMFLRQENAIRLLSTYEPSQEICPEDDGGRACAWALTTFWAQTHRSELEFAAKRHFGIQG